MTSKPDSGIDPERPVYQIIGELNARIAKAEESAGLPPMWYVIPNETLAEFFARADQRISAIPALTAEIEEDGCDLEHVTRDAYSWTGRRTISQQRNILRNSVPKALTQIRRLRESVKEQRLNDPTYLDSLDDLEQSLTQVLALESDEASWGPAMEKLGSTTKNVIAKSDDYIRYFKGSPTLMLSFFLLCCTIMGWNPIIALAGLFGVDPDKNVPTKAS